jgi:hypothetical protein
VNAVRNEFAQWASVSVFHPPIRTNKAALTTIREQIKRALDERHINVSSVKYRLVACTIFSHQDVWYHFLPDIGWVADDEVEASFNTREQKVSVVQPCVGNG